jgi:DNA-binding CsgD family transcriptional regulator
MAIEGGFNLLAEAHADGVYSAVENEHPVAGIQEVSTSWRRCLSEYGIDPGGRAAPQILTASELREIREPVEDLVAAAREENDRLHIIVGKVGYSVLLTSTDGVVIDYRGDPARAAELKYRGIWSGAVWAESVEGTNGIGTCIAEQRPVTVHRTQHFRTRHTGMSCCGAPVFGPDGKIAAVLDVTSIDPDISERSHALALVVAIDSARAIEESLFRRRFRRSWIIFVSVPAAKGATLRLAVDEDLRIVGAGRIARQALGLDDKLLAAGVSLWKLFEHTPLYLRRTSDVMTAQLTLIEGNQPWPALIVPPEPYAPDALLHARSRIRQLGQICGELAGPQLAGTGSVQDSGMTPEIVSALSPREAAILDLIGKGWSNKQIARQLRIAPETVKTHVKHTFSKLGVQRRAQAVLKAQNLGLALSS